MKKVRFLNMFKTAMDIIDITHIAVKVRYKNQEGFEVIIFDRKMFLRKYKYFMEAYNEDMELKNFNEIYISDINFSNDVKYLANEMYGGL